VEWSLDGPLLNLCPVIPTSNQDGRPTKFDPDDPALIDRFPDYTPDIDIGDRPPTPTHEICSGRRPSKKKKFLSAIPKNQLQPNFGGMVLGWPPFKFVSGDPDFQPRWPPSSK
jgi:hypothetical protein